MLNFHHKIPVKHSEFPDNHPAWVRPQKKKKKQSKKFHSHHGNQHDSDGIRFGTVTVRTHARPFICHARTIVREQKQTANWWTKGKRLQIRRDF